MSVSFEDKPNSSFNTQTIHKIAKLARLDLTESEAANYSAQLELILGHINQLGSVNVEGVSPMVHPGDSKNSFLREDVAEPFFRDVKENARSIVSSAPEAVGGGFKVPPIV